MSDEGSAAELNPGEPADSPTDPCFRTKQLWFFPPPRPLHERFGGEFFREIPKLPGVYFFFDEAGRLIYIGKAKNLRRRLGSYRYVHPDRASRKTWRLVNRIRAITWEECADHAAALLKESRLLREHRPRFNRANVWPWSAVYIGVKVVAGRLQLKVGRELDREFQWFGAYKAFAIYAFGALQRLMHQKYSEPSAPLRWFGRDASRSFAIDSGSVEIDHLKQFLDGRSRDFLAGFETRADAIGEKALSSQNLILSDLILLEEFYERGARRNREILGEHAGQKELVTPERLVDWLAVQSA